LSLGNSAAGFQAASMSASPCVQMPLTAFERLQRKTLGGRFCHFAIGRHHLTSFQRRRDWQRFPLLRPGRVDDSSKPEPQGVYLRFRSFRLHFPAPNLKLRGNKRAHSCPQLANCERSKRLVSNFTEQPRLEIGAQHSDVVFEPASMWCWTECGKVARMGTVSCVRLPWYVQTDIFICHFRICRYAFFRTLQDTGVTTFRAGTFASVLFL